VEDGIFSLSDPEGTWGQFETLEKLLREKGIPFDRESGQDYSATPELVIFRPGNPLQYLHFLLCEGQPIVEVQKIRELLLTKSVFRGGSNGEAAALAIERYLDEHFPAYPPLGDYVRARGPA